MGGANSTSKLADHFIGQYPVSKTLRFELIPEGRTLEYIEKDGILEEDNHRAESYKKVKKIIDRYHKAFIDEALDGLKLKGLQEYVNLYKTLKRDEKQEKEFIEIQASLRKQITKCFTSHPMYKDLLKKELIKNDLLIFTEDNPEEKALVEEFSDFTTYFTGFHSNRENMYSDEAKSTSIAYRIVHQNLPKYIDNMDAYAQLRASTVHENILLFQQALNERYGIESIESFFVLDGFSKVITQSGIDIYNCILGGFTDENNSKIQGINEYVNLYNQQIKDIGRKLPKMKPLYKQILSDRESSSFVLEKFGSDNEVLEAVQLFYENLHKSVLSCKDEITVEELISGLCDYDTEKIYIANDRSVTDISQYLFNDWSILNNAIDDNYDKNNKTPKTYKNPVKYHERKEKELKRQTTYSIYSLNYMVKEYSDKPCIIEDYFTGQISEKISNIAVAYADYKSLLEENSDGKSLLKNKDIVAKLKIYLDSVKELQSLIKPLLKGLDEGEKDELFYVELARISDEINKINTLYNKVRNYVTQKPYSVEKIKLNFNKSTLLDGWDRNKERDNLGTILIKDGYYYLGIMNRKHNRIMEDAPETKSQNIYQKMEYKLLPGPNKMLPKVFFSKSRIEEFAPDKELLEKYEKGTHKKGDNFNIEDCHRLIDFFKQSIDKHVEWSEFDFKFSDTKSYADISGFYREVEHQGYKVTFKEVDAEYIDSLVEDGKLYLFKIYNKDFSPYSKGKPNLHTIYWKMLFSEENLKNVIYKLNGQAEIFYRKKSIEDKDIIRHPANKILKNKYPKAKEETSVFPYELIKDKRFTVDKFQFHVPITMNFQAEGENYFNRKVRRLIHNCHDMHIIGIDRGERNLLYLTVIDLQGNIKEQMSLNEIISSNKEGHIHCKDYHLLLDKREEENKFARQNWQTINTIKELKEGYLSQVIHTISELMIKYNAIIVLEDLNPGFKRSRQKFEKQVYQKFEKMLIDKLNYLVDKNLDVNKNGGALHAYQLTDKFESFQKQSKQSGFLFYVPAWNTSKIDPTTGFVNLFYTKYETKEKSKEFIGKFDSIIYNADENHFEFLFDYSNFTYKAEGSRTIWCLCTNGVRIEKYKNSKIVPKWDTKEINLTEEFVKLLEKYHIEWERGNLKQNILEIEDADFYRGFMHLFTLVLQMRNSDNKTGEDWILSPVKNEKGEFFRTDLCSAEYPRDADANGAYNIARKGLWLVEQIQKADIEKVDKVKLAISNKEWLKYAQEHTL